MGCCCSKKCRDPSSFGGDGHRLGTADEAARDAATDKQYSDNQQTPPGPYTDDMLTDEERANIREEILAAVEGHMTKQDKKAMKQKKKPTGGNEPLRGPNSQNTM